jgi:hypothetical protein
MVVVIAFRSSRQFAHLHARLLKYSLHALLGRPDGVVAWVVRYRHGESCLEQWFAF